MLYKTSKKDFALEVIRDNKQQNVIGYKEIDPDTLTFRSDEQKNLIWVQFDNDPAKKRILFDSQIIFVKTNVKNEENT